jgi:hypothetical protein
MYTFWGLIVLYAAITGRVSCLKLSRGNDAFSLQAEQKAVVGLYHNLDLLIKNGNSDVLAMTSSQAGIILESIEAKRLQTIIDRWTIIVSKIESEVHTYSASYQQIYHEMQINIAVSNVFLGYLHVLNESHIVGMGKLASSCPTIWNIGTHFNESIDASKSWLYCVLPYGSMHPTYYPESTRLESLIDERLPWIKYAYTNTYNHNSTVASLYETLQQAPNVVIFIADETKNSWLFMLKLRLKLISFIMELLESKSKYQKLKVYKSAMHVLDSDLLLYDKKISDDLDTYYTQSTQLCVNSTQYSSDGTDSCIHSSFNTNMVVLFMASLVDALKGEIQVEATYYLDLMNVTINQGISTIVNEYNNHQQTALHLAAPMGFQSRSNILSIFNELVVYWESNQKASHFTTSRTTGASSAENTKTTNNERSNTSKEKPSSKSSLLSNQLIVVIILLASGGACYKYLMISKTEVVSNSNKSSTKSNKSVKAASKVIDHKMKKKTNKTNNFPGKKNVSSVTPVATSPVVDATLSPTSRDSDAVHATSASTSNNDLQLYYSDNEEEWQVSSKKKGKSTSNPSHGKQVSRRDSNRSTENNRVVYEQQPKHNLVRPTNYRSTLLKQALSIHPVSPMNGVKIQKNVEKSENITTKDIINEDTNDHVAFEEEEPVEQRRRYSNDNATFPPNPALIAPQYDNFIYYNNGAITPPSTPPMIYYNPYMEHMDQVMMPLSPPIPVLPQSPVGNGYPMYNDVDILSLVRNQIEYYFSEENLAKDTYLKSLMDSNGYVSTGEIVKFRRINILLKCSGGSARILMDAVITSDMLELSGLSVDNMQEILENQILNTKIRSKIF